MKRMYLAALLLCVNGAAFAGTISRTNYSANGTITSALQNSNENTIVTEINGHLNSTNIEAGGIDTANYADGSVTTAKLSATVQASFVPTGVFQYWTGTKLTVPSGWLYCDGSAVSRTTYATLFAVIGTKFGQGDNSTTFNLPDTRGYFVRGQADGQATDPDAASRTAANTGGSTGDAVGSVQTSSITSHGHTASVTDPGHSHSYGKTSPSISVDSTGSTRVVVFNGTGLDTTASQSTGVTVGNSSTGGNETRPRNIYMVGIIKY